MIKVIGLLGRKKGETREVFETHWLEVHAAMVSTVPEVRRYHLNFIVDEPTRSDVPSYGLEGTVDGIAELWFDDVASYRAFRETDAAKEWLKDGAMFIGRSQSFLVTERRILD